MKLKLAISQFIKGFKDSYNGCLQFLMRSISNQTIERNNTKLHQRLLQSCILNGLFLLFCILLFNYALIPIVNWILFKILGQQNYDRIASFMNSFIYFLFSFVWILPVFALSKIFNVLCYQDIADMAYIQNYGKPKVYCNSTFSLVIADAIFSLVLQLIFLIQSSIMSYIPIYLLNKILNQLHIAILYSLYAFEYKWFNMGWNINKRLNFIETRWPYFLGFGLSLSVLTSLPEQYFLSATLFAFLFPALLLSAIEANCGETEKQQLASNTQGPFMSLNLFYVSIYLTDTLFKFINYCKSGKKKSPESINEADTFKIRKKN